MFFILFIILKYIYLYEENVEVKVKILGNFCWFIIIYFGCLLLQDNSILVWWIPKADVMGLLRSVKERKRQLLMQQNLT